MDVEIKITMDAIMEKMHQITWYMMELEKKEISGIKITKKQIENNKLLEKLYQNLQKEYSKLKTLIEEYVVMNNKNLIEDNEEFELNDIERIISIDIANALPVLINEIVQYISTSYISIGYLSQEDSDYFYPNIYENTPFEELNNSEYNLQILNLVSLEARIGMEDKIGRLSFMDKKTILRYLALNKFYKEYAFKKIEQDISDISKSFPEISEEKKQKIKEKLIEQKYIIYMSYLNDKYNGILQEGEVGKLKIAKDALDNGNSESLLSMTTFEIEANVKKSYEELKKDLQIRIKDALNKEKRKIGIKDKKSVGKKVVNKEEKNQKIEEKEK